MVHRATCYHPNEKVLKLDLKKYLCVFLFSMMLTAFVKIYDKFHTIRVSLLIEAP